MNEGTLALLVPFAFFLLVGVIVWMILHFRHKSNTETQETIRLAVDKGNELSPELIEQLGNFRAHPKRDVRVGTMWIAIAIGLALMGVFVPDPSNSALQGLLATAAIPLMIGVAYLAMYRLTGRDKQA
ncbi:DUF6249 domain-containing protein [Microbulbifer marinus]|uniref:DUF6249 domain-containing protein n=1 Tax=Microbulbifer marinus TaxID=658218 RepID=A0A1H4A361_9GAMM|nr:DUF6249 domain-containing protein [Microbulbifer marinus]SEA30337.1 hypothetical protein SAMN05216562_2512 [Microbulbifer marinus]